jgi:ribonuclease HI
MQIYTDGSCDNALTKKGAWGFVVVENDDVYYEMIGYDDDTTNNRMELISIQQAMMWMKRKELTNIPICSDSQYAIQVISGRSTARKNIDLVKDLIALYNKVKPKLLKVKAHSGNKWNEYIDKRVAIVEDKTWYYRKKKNKK